MRQIQLIIINRTSKVFTLIEITFLAYTIESSFLSTRETNTKLNEELSLTEAHRTLFKNQTVLAKAATII